MEGDTPTFLYLIQNGLGSCENPHWGSWGGRYGRVSLEVNLYSDVMDEVEVPGTGAKVFSNQARIWRWRDAFQEDFAARMQWTLDADRGGVNHAPVVIANGSSGPEHLYQEAEAGSVVTLDASATYNPDGDELSVHWFHYKEPTRTQSEVHWPFVPDVEFSIADHHANVEGKPKGGGAVVTVQVPPAEACAVDILKGKALERGQTLHLILEVKDSGTPCMRAYKRIVLQTKNIAAKGASGMVYETATEALEHMIG
jgi:hypothetical protein